MAHQGSRLSAGGPGRRRWGTAATFAILMPSSAWAQTAGPSLATKLPTTTAPVQSTAESLAATDADDQLDEAEEDFADLALEELMQIQVTSVAGRAQPLLDMPAAIYVVTAEDIRRSGHRSIAEALRMVPGLTVGQISPSAWAISSRGFVDRFANNLLVLIDGRTVYDPLFSGVFWHVQDMMFEDLDRIEVVRGPGATLWGANAVNGVINITTKSAKETQGLYIVGGGGTEEQGFGALRYGGQLNQNTYFWVWTKYDNHDNFDNITGASEPNDWDMYRGGFRLDMEGDDDLQMTVQGDIYATGRINERVRVPVPGADLTFTTADLNQQYQGGDVLFRVGRSRSATEGWSLQTYYDRTKTRGGQPGFEVRRDTFDADYRHYAPLGEKNEHVLMWGLGYRHTRDRTTSGPTLSFSPANRSLDTFGGFIQDTVTLIPDELFLMVGSKFEHNDHTGFEYQPSGRISWMPVDNQTVWGAISRAVRTPSRTADDVILTTAFVGGPPFVELQLIGDPSVESEELLAYELGYRVRATDSLTFDVATFYNVYDDLITFPAGAATFGNRGKADTYGVELASTWNVADNWTLTASYTFLEIDVSSTSVAVSRSSKASAAVLPLFAGAADVNHMAAPQLGRDGLLQLGLLGLESGRLSLAWRIR